MSVDSFALLVALAVLIAAVVAELADIAIRLWAMTSWLARMIERQGRKQK